MDRDEVIRLYDRTQVSGLGYMVLLWLLHGATVGELHSITREDRGTIGGVLKSLEIRSLSLRVAVGHADKWYLSEEGAGLLGFSQLREITAVEPLVSGFVGNDQRNQIPSDDQPLTNKPTRPTAGNHSSKPNLSTEGWQLVDSMVSEFGTTRNKAIEAIEVAIEEQPPELIDFEMAKWRAYLCTNYADGISKPGPFIAAKIKNWEVCPTWFDWGRDEWCDQAEKKFLAKYGRMGGDD